jgi:hypothetical protein
VLSARTGEQTKTSRAASIKPGTPSAHYAQSGGPQPYPNTIRSGLNGKSVLLYGSETWRTTKTNSHKLQTFINTCLRNIS